MSLMYNTINERMLRRKREMEESMTMKTKSYDWDIYDGNDNFLRQICDEPTEVSALSHYSNNFDSSGFYAIRSDLNS